MTTVLVVDDDASFRRAWVRLFEAASYSVIEARDGEEALELFVQNDVRLVVLDLMLPPSQKPEEGAQTMRAMLQTRPNAKIIVASGASDLALALNLVKQGAYDFISKPVEPDVLLAVIERAHARNVLETKVETLERRLARSEDLLVGDAATFKEAKTLAEKVAGSDLPILLLGASGTGKEVLARFIHNKSRREAKNFVAVNCGALNANLLESQLFGHKKGAFTGATSDAKGLFIEANDGTLFLDEIGDMPFDLQVKLLRALENQEVMPVGATRAIKINVRIVAATHQPLDEMVQKKTFREDLYWRLKGVEIRLPTLAERPGDILLLAQHFLNAAKANMRLSSEVSRVLESHSWPGNLRELKNEILRAQVMAAGRDELLLEDLSAGVRKNQTTIQLSNDATLDEKVAALEKYEIESALSNCAGNRSHAAEKLGLSRQGLLNKMARYGIA